MKKYQFKTNIKCSGCEAKVAPYLNNEPEITGWQVDLSSADRILKVETNTMSEEEIKKLVNQAGYHADSMDDHA